MSSDVSTIRLARSVIKELAKMRQDGEDYNSVVSRLIDSFKQAQIMEVQVQR